MGFRTDAIDGLTTVAAQAAAHGEQALDKFLGIAGNLASIPALLPNVLLRPRYGTQYHNPITLLFGGGLTCLVLIAAGITGLDKGSVMTVLNSGFMYLLLLALSCYHGRRIWKLILNPQLEKDSRDVGPPLWFVSFLPKSHNWLMQRVVYEPSITVLVSLALTLTKILNPIIGLYFFFGGLALAIKNFIDWWQAFQTIRNLLDQQQRSHVLQRIADRKGTIPEKPEMVMAAIPTFTTQQAAMFAGLSPELERMVSPLKPA